MTPMRRALQGLVWLCLALFGPARAAYPDHPVTLVVPFAAGGPTDRVARDLAEALRKSLGVAVLIENVAGTGGTLGSIQVAKATPDGYTLLLHHIGMATSPALYPHLPFNPLEDFETLGLVNEVPMTLITRPTLPARSYAELLRWMRAAQGRVSLANAGYGSASQLCGLLLRDALRIDMHTVSYKGTSPALAELIEGQVDLMCDQTTNTAAAIAEGRVKAFAVTTPQRLSGPALSPLPTLEELGLKGFRVAIWHGLYAPRGTPASVQATLVAALGRALSDPQFLAHETAWGATVIRDERRTPAGHKAFLARELQRWTPVLRAAAAQGE